MVQVVENRTDLEGVILSRGPDPERPGYDVLAVEVKKASPVQGVADLLSSRVGQRVDLTHKRELLPSGDLAGWSVRFRGSLAGPGVVRADASAGKLFLTPPAADSR